MSRRATLKLVASAPATRDPLDYVLTALASFDGDPPETDYQRGYQAALRDVLKDGFGVTPPLAADPEAGQ